MSQTVGARIRLVRGDMGVGDFADALGVNRKTITRWEADDALPDGASLLALMQRFRVDPGWLLSGGAVAPSALTPREAALLDNYRHSPDDAKAVMDKTSAAFAQSTPAVRRKRDAG